MTTGTSRQTASLEPDLTRMYRGPQPTDELRSRMDQRIGRAVANGRARETRYASRRLVLLGLGMSLVALLGFTGGVVAQRFMADGHFTLIDGVLFSDNVIERPGLTNFGEPFAGTSILEGTPAQAEAIAAAKGYAITWQLEDRAGTEATDDDHVALSNDTPTCGSIAGGSVVEVGGVQLVVLIDDPLTPGSEC